MSDARRRILLVRLDGLGDALVTVPALEGLHRAFPDASFGAVCSLANAAVFSSQRVERVHVYEGAESAAAVFAELRSACYTDAIVATEETIGYRLARVSCARRRAGFWHRFEKPFKSLWQWSQLTHAVYRPAAWVDEPEHEVETMYRLAERLGAVRPIPHDAVSLRPWINAAPEGAIRGGATTLAMQIAAKLTSGGWGPAGIAGFAAAALAASPFSRCLLLAGESDEGLARAVMEQLPRSVVAEGRVARAPAVAMPLWLGAIASAGALISPDTGAAHAAGILGVPVVDLFDPERNRQLEQQWRPWAAPSRCVTKPPYRPGVESLFGAEIGRALRELVVVSGATR